MQKISFLMNGSSGRMGRALALGLGSRENMRLAAAVDTKPGAKSLMWWLILPARLR